MAPNVEQIRNPWSKYCGSIRDIYDKSDGNSSANIQNTKMAENEGLTRLRAIRRGNRAVVTESINEVQGLLTTEQWSEESITRLNVLKQHLDSKQNTLNELDPKILNEIKVEDVEKEIEEAEDVVIKITEAREKIERAMRTINATSQLTTVEDNSINEQAASAGTANVLSATTRLPKLQLPHSRAM